MAKKKSASKSKDKSRAKAAKKKKKKGAAGSVRESAEKIWLAGLGALAVAEEEGGKLFRTLVSKGEEYHAGDTVRRAVDDVRSRAGKTVAEVEAVIDSQVADALHRVGVPTRDEIADLTARVEELTRIIESRGTRRKKSTRRASKRTGGRASA